MGGERKVVVDSPVGGMLGRLEGLLDAIREVVIPDGEVLGFVCVLSTPVSVSPTPDPAVFLSDCVVTAPSGCVVATLGCSVMTLSGCVAATLGCSVMTLSGCVVATLGCSMMTLGCPVTTPREFVCVELVMLMTPNLRDWTRKIRESRESEKA